VVHQRVRLGILTVLREAERADFTYSRTSLDVTDGNLSRHIAVLEEAGYIKVTKVFEDRKPRTWLSATPNGKKALQRELTALQNLIDGAGGG